MFSHEAEGRCGVDRCALFVDAGYLLPDGAMAVHGTRRRESVSWDYPGLLQLLSGLAIERSGLPLLRCYWYEATVEGRRSAEHDTLADLPGVKLRLAKMRPGHREGVESEIHRDLTTLARNKAVSDAMVVSAEEDLAQVVADVQDLGMRVTLLHIAVEGDGTISRALRQECDDIVEVNSAHLRPHVELISGAEPPRPDEREDAALVALHPKVNGHAQAVDTAPYPPASHGAASQGAASQGAENGLQVRTATYTVPAEGAAPQAPQSPAGDLAAVAADSPAGEPASAPVSLPPEAPERRAGRDVPAAQQDAQPVQPEAPAEQDQGAAQEEPAAATPVYFGAPPSLAVIQPEQARVRPPLRQEPPPRPEYAPRPDWPAGPVTGARQDVYGASPAVPAPPDEQPAGLPAWLPAARSRPAADVSGYHPGAMREQPPLASASPESLSAGPGGPGGPGGPDEAGDSGEPGGDLLPVPAASAEAQVRRLPTRGTSQPAQPAAGAPGLSAPRVAPTAAQPMPAQPPSMPPWVAQPPAGPLAASQPEAGQPLAGQPGGGHFSDSQFGGSQFGGGFNGGQPGAGQPSGQPSGQPGAGGEPLASRGTPVSPGAGYTATRNGSYTGPRPVVPLGPGGGAPPAPGGPAAPAAPSAPDIPAASGSPAAPGTQAAPGGPAGLPGQAGQPASLVPPTGGPQPGLGGPGGPGGPGGQPGSGYGIPNLPAPAGSPPGAVNGIGQPNVYGQPSGGPVGLHGVPGGPGALGGPLGPAGPAYSGTQAGISLADAVQSAHQEGQNFGESVARDAPALWLEAVLARKPRMPSDLEARLLQGSALPIDFLLHDEVRHALRRGFWDALERSRR
jgi:NYN domain